MQPALFLSHGSPMLPLQHGPERAFFAGLSAQLVRPAAVVMVSAHWETAVPTVNAVTTNEAIHDFHGFPPELYQMAYPAPGSPDLAERIVDLLANAGLRAATDGARGLDHGAWAPLSLIWPDHSVPVIQVSVQSRLGPGHHLQLGRALAALRADNVLVVGSGGITHNLRALHEFRSGTLPDWAAQFIDWLHQAILAGRTCDLVSYRQLAPFAAHNHPTDEHLLPLFVALGAAGERPVPARLPGSTAPGMLGMDSYRFD